MPESPLNQTEGQQKGDKDEWENANDGECGIDRDHLARSP
jgi:hypothetical protein